MKKIKALRSGVFYKMHQRKEVEHTLEQNFHIGIARAVLKCNSDAGS
jgi:hypothetical protein